MNKIFAILFFSIPFFASCNVLLNDVKADHPFIKYFGRVDFTNPLKPRFAYSGVSIKAKFTGTSCSVKLNNYSEGLDEEGNAMVNYYNIFVDGALQVVKVENGSHVVKVASGLKDTIHSLQIFKRTEAVCGVGEFEGFRIDKGKTLVKFERENNRAVEFIGNSITCGYGNEGANRDCHFTPITENNYLAYGAITARALKADYSAVCFSGRGVIRNYDKTYTNPMPELYERTLPNDSELKWDFRQQVPDAVVINLGTNDFAHENPDSAGFVNAYRALLLKVKSNYPKAKIFCIVGPMMSDSYPPGNRALSTCKAFINGAIVASGSADVYFCEMSAQGRNGYGCDWHPNLKQHEINAAELTAFIREKMVW